MKGFRFESGNHPMELWEAARARLSHDWLRNRWALALGKLINVLDGAVSDPRTIVDVRSLLQQWTERRMEADRVIALSSNVLSPRRFLAYPLFSQVDDEMKQFLGKVAEDVWRKSARLECREIGARSALDELNALCLRLLEALPDEGRGDANCLAQVRSLAVETRQAVSRLAATLTELGQCAHF